MAPGVGSDAASQSCEPCVHPEKAPWTSHQEQGCDFSEMEELNLGQKIVSCQPKTTE